ncbi:MAG: hypothetical protein H6R18_595 [Proteobacteria bacterium]|nr:hypothetical protein [Pseudomonadota bacterium]
MYALLKKALLMAGLAIATQAIAQITFYENQGFQGRSFSTETQIRNFQRYGFNDRATSAEVVGNRWEVCEDARYNGQCAILRPGRYPSLAAMGLNNKISSARIVSRNAHIDDNRYAPAPVAEYDYYRHRNEKLYEANVTSVRAVVGSPEQRCWVESEQVVVQDRRQTNVPGAIVGAIIGGILGHQVGGGHGKDIMTAGGAVAGGVIGSRVGRNDGQRVTTQDVQRCTSVPGQVQPNFWDVVYNFRGQEHRVQMTTRPGSTVTVNEQGEPRL